MHHHCSQVCLSLLDVEHQELLVLQLSFHNNLCVPLPVSWTHKTRVTFTFIKTPLWQYHKRRLLNIFALFPKGFNISDLDYVWTQSSMAAI